MSSSSLVSWELAAGLPAGLPLLIGASAGPNVPYLVPLLADRIPCRGAPLHDASYGKDACTGKGTVLPKCYQRTEYFRTYVREYGRWKAGPRTGRWLTFRISGCSTFGMGYLNSRPRGAFYGSTAS